MDDTYCGTWIAFAIGKKMILFLAFVVLMLVVTGLLCMEAAKGGTAKSKTAQAELSVGTVEAVPSEVVPAEAAEASAVVGDAAVTVIQPPKPKIVGSEQSVKRLMATMGRTLLADFSDDFYPSYFRRYTHQESARMLTERLTNRVLTERLTNLPFLVARSLIVGFGQEEIEAKSTEELRKKVEALEVELSEIKRSRAALFVPVRSYRSHTNVMYADMDEGASDEAAQGRQEFLGPVARPN